MAADLTGASAGAALRMPAVLVEAYDAAESAIYAALQHPQVVGVSRQCAALMLAARCYALISALITGAVPTEADGDGLFEADARCARSHAQWLHFNAIDLYARDMSTVAHLSALHHRMLQPPAPALLAAEATAVTGGGKGALPCWDDVDGRALRFSLHKLLCAYGLYDAADPSGGSRLPLPDARAITRALVFKGAWPPQRLSNTFRAVYPPAPLMAGAHAAPEQCDRGAPLLEWLLEPVHRQRALHLLLAVLELPPSARPGVQEPVRHRIATDSGFMRDEADAARHAAELNGLLNHQQQPPYALATRLARSWWHDVMGPYVVPAHAKHELYGDPHNRSDERWARVPALTIAAYRALPDVAFADPRSVAGQPPVWHARLDRYVLRFVLSPGGATTGGADRGDVRLAWDPHTGECTGPADDHGSVLASIVDDAGVRYRAYAAALPAALIAAMTGDAKTSAVALLAPPLCRIVCAYLTADVPLVVPPPRPTLSGAFAL